VHSILTRQKEKGRARSSRQRRHCNSSTTKCVKDSGLEKQEARAGTDRRILTEHSMSQETSLTSDCWYHTEGSQSAQGSFVTNLGGDRLILDTMAGYLNWTSIGLRPPSTGQHFRVETLVSGKMTPKGILQHDADITSAAGRGRRT